MPTTGSLGDVLQLRDAIHQAHPSRRDEFYAKRSAYRRNAVEQCTNPDKAAMKDCLSRLGYILQWKPEDVEILIRRSILFYRLRQVAKALEDLDKAVQLSTEMSLVDHPNLDALRYRSLVLNEIKDTQACSADIAAVMQQTKTDPLALSLRASIRAGESDLEGARADMEAVQKALETGGGSQSTLADENRDLDLLAKGWAHSSVGSTQGRQTIEQFGLPFHLRVERCSRIDGREGCCRFRF